MDVIINNPPAQTYQTQGMPYAYGPQMYGYRHHDGPPVGLIALLIAGFVLFKRRRWAGRAYQRSMNADVAGDIGKKFRQSRERFFNDGALDIARERYAKGEINADEYETLRRNLTGEHPQNGTSSPKPQDDRDLKL